MLMPLGLMGSSASGPRTGPDDTGPDDDTGLIHLKYANFDPSAGKPQVPSHLASLDDSRLALVQLEGATQPGWYSTLEDQGLTILRYIPQYTYLVFENGQGGLERTADLDFVTWVGPYHPAYKIDPELAAVQGDVELTVEIKLFPELTSSRDRATIMDLIRTLEGDILDTGQLNDILTVRMMSPDLPVLAALDRVEWLSLHGELVAVMDNIRIFTGTEEMHTYEVTGEPIVGEIKDNGIDQDHQEFEGQLIGTDGNVEEADHGTSTFGIVYAKGVDERALGQSHGSGGVFCQWNVPRLQSIRNLVNNWDGLFQSNSWHQGSANSQYSSYSEENDRAVMEYDVSMLYAAGNGGSDESISQDATAKNVITVGGLDHFDNTDREDDRHSGNEGNKGPTEDGRYKPDLSGPYDAIYTTTGDNGYTSSFGGTSGATPVTAGALSLAYQLYKANHFGNNPSGEKPHAATIKALAIANAYQHDLTRADRFAQGWGYIDMDYLHGMGVNHLIVDEEVALETGQSFSVNFQPTTITPLKISLVWTSSSPPPRGTPTWATTAWATTTTPSWTVSATPSTTWRTSSSRPRRRGSGPSRWRPTTSPWTATRTPRRWTSPSPWLSPGSSARSTN